MQLFIHTGKENVANAWLAGFGLAGENQPRPHRKLLQKKYLAVMLPRQIQTLLTARLTLGDCAEFCTLQ
jgi:hypothetical protein